MMHPPLYRWHVSNDKNDPVGCSTFATEKNVTCCHPSFSLWSLGEVCHLLDGLHHAVCMPLLVSCITARKEPLSSFTKTTAEGTVCLSSATAFSFPHKEIILHLLQWDLIFIAPLRPNVARNQQPKTGLNLDQT